MASASTMSSPFAVLGETIDLTLSQLNEKSDSRNHNYLGINEFWNAFVSTSKVVSHEATKLSLTLSKPPYPSREEIKPYADNIEKAVISLLTAYVKLNPSYGSTLNKIVKTTLLNILTSIRSLCTEVTNLSPSLVSIGNVWEQCNKVPNLPKDNKEAVLQNVISELGLVDDALTELQGEVTGVEDEQECQWNDLEKQMIPYCLGLIKASKALLKKLKSSWREMSLENDDPNGNRLLDEVNSLVILTSSYVDDFILSIYPPIDHSHLKNNSKILMEHLIKVLEILKNGPNWDWIDFLTKAILHNYDKIDELALED